MSRPKKGTPLTPKEQSARFEDMARELDVDKKNDALPGLMRKVADLKRPLKKKLS